MLRGIKRKLVKFSDTQEQAVIYVQTPQQARKQPEPKTSNEEVIDTFERFPEMYKGTLGFLESIQFSPPEPKSFFIQDGIICDQDVTIVMPDGAKLYADIYRPDTVEKVPVILCWSPYGKNQLKVIPSSDGKWNVCGVAEDAISKYTKFESADPCYWCNYGYAICNIDPRGAYNSEGDVSAFAVSEADDACRVIEWLAEQSWSSGKVATFGNSYLGVSQWNIAAKNPPHLVCIAPWDASSDIYRDLACMGGIPDNLLVKFIAYKAGGLGYSEDVGAMLEDSPYFNCSYWESKRYEVEKINIPVYCSAGWTGIHLRGTVNAYERLKTDKKWIRFHRTWEWADNYVPEHLEDLRRFYDRYLKDINNGWEMTPRVRLDVMDSYDCDFQKYRPEFDFPLPRTEYKKLFLDSKSSTLDFTPTQEETKVVYDSQTGEANFDIKFEEDVEITGHIKLKLWAQVEGHNNMDLLVTMKKLSTKGEELPLYYFDTERYANTSLVKIKQWSPMQSLTTPYPGSMARMRVSRRKLDEKLSTDFHPVQAHTDDEYLSPGEIVPVEIEFWPTSRIWHKGQTLRISISGQFFKRESWSYTENPSIDNKGHHIIHTGGKYDSYLQIPVIPPKYQDADYVYR